MSSVNAAQQLPPLKMKLYCLALFCLGCLTAGVVADWDSSDRSDDYDYYPYP